MSKVDVVCAGLNVVNFPVFPVDESIFTRDLTPVSPITLLPGGDAANQAIILSRLGFKTALLSRRGNDEFGDLMLELLRKHGRDIDLSGIVVDPVKATSVCAMMIKPDGHRHFCSHKGAIFDFCLDDIDLSILSGAKVASIGGMFGLPSFDGKGSQAFFKAAKEQGVITVADTKADLMGIGLAGIRDTLAYTDYFFPSYDEAAAISKETKPERMARVFLDAGAKNVGIKLGSKGCYMSNTHTDYYLPVIPSKVVDTTGAGDNFMSGFIAGLLQGWDVRGCCEFGTAAAALCVSQVGPTSAVKNFKQVMAVMTAGAIT